MARKQGASEEYALTEEQLQLLWNKCKDPRDKMIVGLAGFCGMRVGEICHFRLSWIREGDIHIPSAMLCNCNECKDRGGVWKPKSRAGIRVIPIPLFLKAVFIDYLDKFPNGVGMTRQAVWYRIQQLAVAANLRIFPHSLRATATTILAKKGLTAVELCQMFGWARLDMGEHYIRISEAREGVKKKFKEIWG